MDSVTDNVVSRVVAAPSRTRRILAAWAALVFVGFMMTALGNYELARYAERVRDSRPETHIDAAEALMNRGDFPGALKAWEAAYARAPKAPVVLKVLGDIHYNLKHWNRALAAYREALALGSDSVGVRCNLVWCLVELGHNEEAVTFSKKCIAEGAADPELYRRAAEACFRARMFDEAVPFFETALRNFTNDMYLMEHLRMAYEALGKADKVKEVEAHIAQVQTAINTAKGNGS